MEVLTLYVIGVACSWYLMFLFMCWFGPRTWPVIYKHDGENQRRTDMIATGFLACLWPMGIPSLLLVSAIWSFKK